VVDCLLSVGKLLVEVGGNAVTILPACSAAADASEVNARRQLPAICENLILSAEANTIFESDSTRRIDV
jgi:hypothetical protein